jgi:hypothetical protein
MKRIFLMIPTRQAIARRKPDDCRCKPSYSILPHANSLSRRENEPRNASCWQDEPVGAFVEKKSQGRKKEESFCIKEEA